MLVKPMIGSWEVPRITRITAYENRRLVCLPVPGLDGDLHQDFGRSALTIDIQGSLYGDEARDSFLKELEQHFSAGDPVDFVADIINESTLEQVIIETLALTASAENQDQTHYHMRLREYTEPPPPAGLDFGLEAPGLDLDIELGLDLLDLPQLLVPLPEVGDLLTPLEPAAKELRNTVNSAVSVFTPLEDLFDNPPAGDS